MSRRRYKTASKRDLTPRQRDVLALIAAGKTNREIGEALGMTLDGAKFHVGEIIAKLGVSTREEAAEWWRREAGVVSRLGGAMRAALGMGAVKWTAGVAAAVGVLALVMLVLGERGGDELEPSEYHGWVNGENTDAGMELRGAGWPVGIEQAVLAEHIVLGTLEAIGEGRRGSEPFPVYRIATVRVNEVIATGGEPLGQRVNVLMPGGRVDGVDVAVFDVGPDFITGDEVLLYLNRANFEWLEPGVWMTWLDQRIFDTPVNAATPRTLPLDTVIRAIRERRD
jgi:DNA-binding CsgD family transcriptional regulator